MRGAIVTIVAAVSVLFASYVHAGCGSAGRVWASDDDGSSRITYIFGKDRVELVYREDERVLVARGHIAYEGLFLEAYSVYDLETGYLVAASSRVSDNPKGLFPREYSMQSHFDIDVYSASPSFREEVSAALATSKQKGCEKELTKLISRRDYDKAKCDGNFQTLRDILALFVRPSGEKLQEMTQNAQFRKFVDGIRNTRNQMVLGIFTDKNDPDGSRAAYCTGIQKMDMKIIGKLRDPETQKALAVKQRMPDYLDEPKDFETRTKERIR